jgi:hypothetical protein
MKKRRRHLSHSRSHGCQEEKEKEEKDERSCKADQQPITSTPIERGGILTISLGSPAPPKLENALSRAREEKEEKEEEEEEEEGRGGKCEEGRTVEEEGGGGDESST